MRTKTLVITAAAALALAACATQEAPKPAPAPAPAPTPAPAPVAKPATPSESEMEIRARAAREAAAREAAAKAAAAKKPAVVNLSSTELFEFNKATLTAEARGKLDSEVIAKLKDVASVRYIIVNGHADRLGSAQYNQRLSEKRADAVRAYLVSKGVGGDKVETLGFGKTLPVKSCPDQKARKALIECLAPNRRVVVEIQGTPR